MSLHDAISNAAQAALEPYLAPELVEKLTADIVARARLEMEAALETFLGFEPGKPATSRTKANAVSPGRAARKRKEPTPPHQDSLNIHEQDGNGSKLMMG